jgi:DNA-binding HxlR family transcriptional regulator
VVIAFDRKWSLRIISALGNYGELSFNQILKIFLGLTSKVLSETLKDLEKRGLIERDEDGGRIYYRLTKEGLEFKKSLIPMLSWALRKYGPSIFKNSCCNINITAENLAL